MLKKENSNLGNKIKIAVGDITQLEVDGIITPINSEGFWFGGIDRAIQGVAGNFYHKQAAAKQLSDLMTVVALGKQSQHTGKFDHVVFVVDDLKSPLNQVVKKGLEAAGSAGMKTVSIPAMRTGVMLGAVEANLAEVADKLVVGVREYFNDNSNSGIELVSIVVYNNNTFATTLFRGYLKDLLNKKK